MHVFTVGHTVHFIYEFLCVYVLIGGKQLRKNIVNNMANILSGFQINWVMLNNPDTHEILWESNQDLSSSDQVFRIDLPKRVLQINQLHRHVNFSTVDAWENMRIVCTTLYKGNPMDKTEFEYGPVAANSKTTWISRIEGTKELRYHHQILNGNVEIITSFYNSNDLITKSTCKVYYY